MPDNKPKQRKKQLNGRQQLFVGYYCEGPTKGNIEQSLLKAGYSAKYARHFNSKMLAMVGISEAIAARRAVIADKEGISIESTLKRFEDQYTLCEGAKDRVNAIRILENLSKHVGLYEQDNRQRGSELPKLTPEEEAIIRSNAIKLTNRRDIA